MLIFFKRVPATGQGHEQRICMFVMMLPNNPMISSLRVHAYSPGNM